VWRMFMRRVLDWSGYLPNKTAFRKRPEYGQAT
jgi:hypothetical protein